MYASMTEVFNKRVDRYLMIVKKHLSARLSAATDRSFVFEEITNEVDMMKRFLVATKKASLLVEDFLTQYKVGNPMEKIMTNLRRDYGVNEQFLIENGLNLQNTIVINESDEDGKVTKLASDEKQLFRYLVQVITIHELKQQLPQLFVDTQSDTTKSQAYPVQWTASRDNKTEFVQLIYALHEAGYLNNGTGEITKIVESLADTLSVSLSKNWQSNLSASIHKSNSDYQPPIFGKIATAYTGYADRLITAKKNNK